MKMEKALKETIDKAKKERESNEGEKIFLITVSGQGIPIQKLIFFKLKTQ